MSAENWDDLPGWPAEPTRVYEDRTRIFPAPVTERRRLQCKLAAERYMERQGEAYLAKARARSAAQRAKAGAEGRARRNAADRERRRLQRERRMAA